MDGVPYETALAIWGGLQEQWVSTVVNWNLNGVKWREFSAAEMLWMVHTNTIQNLKEDKPSQVRLYLTKTRDYTALREWDVSQMKDSSDR